MDGLTIEKRKMAEPWYYKERSPLLNPELFLDGEDEYIVITGRALKHKNITEVWLKKFCPTYKKLYVADLGAAYNLSTEEIKNWSESQAILKSKFINEEKLDVYFEDNGTVVKELRKLCPNTKIIHYGGGLY